MIWLLGLVMLTSPQPFRNTRTNEVVVGTYPAAVYAHAEPGSANSDSKAIAVNVEDPVLKLGVYRGNSSRPYTW